MSSCHHGRRASTPRPLARRQARAKQSAFLAAQRDVELASTRAMLEAAESELTQRRAQMQGIQGINAQLQGIQHLIGELGVVDAPDSARALPLPAGGGGTR